MLEVRTVNMYILTPDEREQLKDVPVTEEDEVRAKQAARWATTGSAYALEHGTRPATISLALMTNPLAMLAW